MLKRYKTLNVFILALLLTVIFTVPTKAEAPAEEFNGAIISLQDLSVGETNSVTLADGSVITVELLYEEVDEGISTYSWITGSFGTQFKDYLISKTKGGATASFRATGWIARYGSSSIREVHSGYVSGFGAGSLPELKIVREVESTNTSAFAQMRWQNTATVGGGWGHISASIPIGTTNFLYMAIIKQNMYISDVYPNL